MTRHIIDTSKSPSQRRISEFVRIDRSRSGQLGLGKSFRQMHKLGDQTRMRAFLRIARGYRA